MTSTPRQPLESSTERPARQPEDTLVDELSHLSCSSVSDALDRLGLPGSAFGLLPLSNGTRMAGPAFTVRYAPIGFPPGTVGDYIDDVPEGAVIVLDNQARRDCTVWGDILTAVALDRRIAGTAINGVCRDVHRALSTGYPMYSVGRFMRTGKDRVEAVETGGTVVLGDVQVAKDDLVLGDDDGVVVVPRAKAAEVLELARAIADTEAQVLDMVRAGSTLRAARAKLGYHLLQRRAAQ